MADTTDDNFTLPTFDDEDTYWLKGSTLNKIINVIKRNKVVIDDGNFREIGEDGSHVETVELQVCIDGVVKTRNFLIAHATD